MADGALRREPRMYRAFHMERAREGRQSYFYASRVSTTYTSSVDSVNCYTELWRGPPQGNLGCIANTFSDCHPRLRMHFAKNA
jgi:hypothetical protein